MIFNSSKFFDTALDDIYDNDDIETYANLVGCISDYD